MRIRLSLWYSDSVVSCLCLSNFPIAARMTYSFVYILCPCRYTDGISNIFLIPFMQNESSFDVALWKCALTSLTATDDTTRCKPPELDYTVDASAVSSAPLMFGFRGSIAEQYYQHVQSWNARQAPVLDRFAYECIYQHDNDFGSCRSHRLEHGDIGVVVDRFLPHGYSPE